jgi:hypothetical protein
MASFSATCEHRPDHLVTDPTFALLMLGEEPALKGYWEFSSKNELFYTYNLANPSNFKPLLNLNNG